MTRKKTGKRLLFLFLALLAGTGIYLTYQRYYQLSYIKETYTESADTLNNPYQGWYRIYGYALSEERTIDPESIEASWEDDPDTRLALLEINLCSYAEGDIGTTGLKQLDTIFSTWEKSSKQLIVRFLYDWDGKAKETEPADISIITRHMTQVSDAVNRYSDSIYLMQGIFVGNYGEMNSSAFLSEADMRTLFSHLAAVTDDSIYLSVRTPAQWRTVLQSFSPLSGEEAFSGSDASRLGLFNDGMLGSESDLGTYGVSSLADITSYSEQGTREDEIAFQNELCRYVPNGGEVVLDNSYNDFDNAILDLAAMHVSYLDYDYDTDVLDKWKAAVFQGDTVFDGQNGYDYIGNHLGYRYVLRSSDCSFNTWEDDMATLSLSIENVGFANTCRDFNVSVLLLNAQTQEVHEITIETDCRDWQSGSATSLSLPLDVRGLGSGSYELYFKLSDPGDGAQIQLANELSQSTYGYPLGTLTIAKPSLSAN